MGVFLEFEPDKIHDKMLDIYEEQGGEPMYMGDEKDIIIRTVLETLVQSAFAYETAAKNQTLRYASGKYLDLIGEKRGVIRLSGEPARVKARLTILGNSSTHIAPGVVFRSTLSNASQDVYFTTVESIDVYISGESTTYELMLFCVQDGPIGNGEVKGTVLYPIHQGNVIKAELLGESYGGTYGEDDEEYRERIRNSAIESTVTGTKIGYERKAKASEGSIIDANAVRLENASIKVYILCEEHANTSAVLKTVKEALSENDRPLSDIVDVELAKAVDYTLTVQYKLPELNSNEVNEKIVKETDNFKKAMESEIGISFDVYKLISALYVAGAVQVSTNWQSSTKPMGDVQRVALTDSEYWKGKIQLTLQG